MRKWFISRIDAAHLTATDLLDELNSIEADKRAKYTVQTVLYVDGQYQILYTKE